MLTDMCLVNPAHSTPKRCASEFTHSFCGWRGLHARLNVPYLVDVEVECMAGRGWGKGKEGGRGGKEEGEGKGGKWDGEGERREGKGYV